jgi:cobalt-precorrin-5B (C1)-methyltransferase
VSQRTNSAGPVGNPAASSGYTLPVWAAAAARAALQTLLEQEPALLQPLQLAPGAAPEPVPVEAAARLAPGRALAIARCDPGEGVLDLTRGLALWLQACWLEGPGESLELEAGEGVGRIEASGAPCLSAYARDLLRWNLEPLLPDGRRLGLTLVIPDGRRLAERTSNAAFGVVQGLALIGTQARVQRSAAPEQLQAALDALAARAADPGFNAELVLVIGENGLDLAPRLGLPPQLLLKAGNWLGPLLVAAAEAGVRRLLLFGYQGKLIKLAGGIFHTHHHLADGRAAVLTAHAALEGLSGAPLARLHGAASVDQGLRDLDAHDPALAWRLRRRLAEAIEVQSRDYLQHHGQGGGLQLGAVLFDRQRRLCACSTTGAALLRHWQVAEPLQGGAEGDA